VRNPFRRHKPVQDEQRTLDVGSVHYPLGYGPSVVNEAVEWQAFRLAPVFAAGRLLASSVASLPLQQYSKSGDTRRKLPLSSLFAAPSATGTLHDWVWRAVTALAYSGNAVGVVTQRNSLEYATAIEWLQPDRVFVEDANPAFGERGSFTNPVWTYMGSEIPREDIVHIPWFVMPGRVWGLSPLGAYQSTVQIGLDAQKYKADWFTNGGVPPGQFRNQNQTVDQEKARIISDRMMQSIRSRKPLVYGSDWEYTPFAVPQSDAQFVETMRLTATQIASIYGIPPEMIGGETGASMTYQNVEQQAINFVQFTLLPWLTKLEDAMSNLLPRNQYVKFNADALVRVDSQTRYLNYRAMRDIGMANVDELRALEDLAPLPFDKGQDYTPLSVMIGWARHQQAFDPAVHQPATPLPDETPNPGLKVVQGKRDVSELEFGKGSKLWKYWTEGEGLAKWAAAVHKWTELHRALIEAGVPAHMVDGLTTNIIEHVFPGYMKTHGKGA